MARKDEAYRINFRKFSDKAEEIYAKIRVELESKHWGEILIIEPDSGDYFLGKTSKEAEKKFMKNIQMNYTLCFVWERSLSVGLQRVHTH